MVKSITSHGISTPHEAIQKQMPPAQLNRILSGLAMQANCVKPGITSDLPKQRITQLH
jgi:hypothetical protein